MSDSPDTNVAATAEPAVEPAVPAVPEGSPKWLQIVGALAKTIGQPYEKVSKALVDLVGTADDESLASLADPECCSNDLLLSRINSAFPGLPVVKLNKAVKDLRGAATTATPAAAVVTEHASAVVAQNTGVLLPNVPDNESFLSALRIGGVSIVTATEVNAALRVKLATDLGVYDVPAKLMAQMKTLALRTNKPLGETYYKMQKKVNQKRYADIFAAMGAEGHHMSEADKRELLGRMTGLWDTLGSFQKLLVQWYDAWMLRTSNPQAVAAAILGSRHPGSATALMNRPPEVDPIKDSTAGVIDNLNRMFAGTGVLTARGMARDVIEIREMLSDPGLPAAVGSPDRETMLQEVGAALTSDYERLEKNLVRYVLALMEFAANNVATEREAEYLGELYFLGQNIPWDKLDAMKAATSSTRKRNGDGNGDGSSDDGKPFRRFDQG